MNILTVDLEESLLVEKQKTLNEEQEEIKKAELILASFRSSFANEAEEDMKIIENAGFNLNQIKTAKSIIENRKKVFNKIDNNRVFTDEEIKRICLKYRLRCLETKHYKGHLSPELPAKLRDLKRLGIGNYSHSNDNFYIVAPASSFVLTPKPKDPLFFVRLDREHFYLVHKWGNDLSIARRALGFITDYTYKYVILSSITTSAFIRFVIDPVEKGNIAFSIFGFIVINLIFWLIVEENNLSSDNNWSSKFSN